MRTLHLAAALLVAAVLGQPAGGQTPLSGEPPRPLELIPADGTSPTPPLPGPYVPPTSSGYAPPAAIPITPSQNALAPSQNSAAPVYQPAVPTFTQSEPAYDSQALPANPPFDQPPDISPNNPDKWRYVNRNGQWWYFTPTKQWMYWSEGRWVEYARPAVSNTSAYVQPPVVARRRRLNLGVGVGAGYYPYGAYPYGPYPYGYGGGAGVY